MCRAIRQITLVFTNRFCALTLDAPPRETAEWH